MNGLSVPERTGEIILSSARNAGDTVLLLGRALRYLPAVPRKRRDIIDLCFVYGVLSIPVTAIVALFSGMILSLQTGVQFGELGLQDQLGTLVAIAMCREMGPFITGLILTATVGSSLATELGTMQVSEEIDALEVMSVSPVSYLVMPRLVTMAIVTPLLTVLTDAVGIIGGAIIASTQLGVSFELYFDKALDALTTLDPAFGLPKDIYTGLVKAVVFGSEIAIIGCAAGLRAAGGALGVGRATRSAVVSAFLLIIISSYFLSWIFYR
jgi:phospholipid/cholesterol/gamma-HCH transport system permease protein